jgi:hypothetical protein
MDERVFSEIAMLENVQEFVGSVAEAFPEVAMLENVLDLAGGIE